MRQNDRLKTARVDKGIGPVLANQVDKKIDNFTGQADDKPLMHSTHGGISNINSSLEVEGTEYVVFVFPEHPTFFDYVTFVPQAILHSLTNMSRAFGWRFVAMIIIVYGLQVIADFKFDFKC